MIVQYQTHTGRRITQTITNIIIANGFVELYGIMDDKPFTVHISLARLVNLSVNEVD